MISTQVNDALSPKPYVINRHSVRGLHPLPPVPVNFVRCPPIKFRAPLKIMTDALKCKRGMPVCASGGEARAGSGNQEPLWKSFGKAIENLGKKSSVEDILKQQIEKREYYDEGGNPPGGRGGGSGGGGGGGFGGLGGSEEEGFSGVIDETIQVVLATLGFIFLYMYIIRGAEMTRLAKDYFAYMIGGKKSVRLARALHVWERFCKRLTNWTEKEEVDPYWLERAIIRTPTWWDSPQKYERIIKTCVEVPSSSSSNHDEDDNDSMNPDQDSMNPDQDSMSDEFQEWR